jgi:hypothetical protein
MNASIRAHDRILTCSDHRAYLQHHTAAIMRYNSTMARSMVSAQTAPPAYDVYGDGAPILYTFRTPRPLVQTSDLKEAYLKGSGGC